MTDRNRDPHANAFQIITNLLWVQERITPKIRDIVSDMSPHLIPTERANIGDLPGGQATRYLVDKCVVAKQLYGAFFAAVEAALSREIREEIEGEFGRVVKEKAGGMLPEVRDATGEMVFVFSCMTVAACCFE